MPQDSIFLQLKIESGNSRKKKREFKLAVKSIFKGRHYRCISTNIAVFATFHTNGTATVDIDNMLKTLLDSMQGIFFENDQQVKKIIASIEENSFVEGVSFSIRKIHKTT